MYVSPQPVEATDDAFWDQFWADTATSVQDVFALVPAAEIRAVREESPSNLATLCYKVRFSAVLLLGAVLVGRCRWINSPMAPKERQVPYYFLVPHDVLACPCLLLMVTLGPSSLGLAQTTAGICSLWSLFPLVPFLCFSLPSWVLPAV